MENKKKLGIDAKWYFDGPPSGNVVVKNLVDEILKIKHQQFDIYLFVDKNFKEIAEKHFEGIAKVVAIRARPNLLSNLFILPYYANKHKIDIMFFQNFSSLWPAKFKKVTHIHDVLFLDYPQYYTALELLYFKPMTILAKHTHKIIAISQSEKNRLINHNITTAENIAVVYHGVHENFKPLNQYTKEEINKFDNNYSLPEKFILFVGRVNIRKNILNLVKAIELLKDKYVKLVIVGGGKMVDDNLKALLNQPNLADKIIFTGHIKEEDIYLMYAKATVFCFPSYAEGFGIPPIEAMQCGIPVVVSDRTCLPEVCGDAALYINPDNSNDIAKKIEMLLTDRSLYDQKSLASIAHAKKFSWKLAAEEILNIIDAI